MRPSTCFPHYGLGRGASDQLPGGVKLQASTLQRLLSAYRAEVN